MARRSTPTCARSSSRHQTAYRTGLQTQLARARTSSPNLNPRAKQASQLRAVLQTQMRMAAQPAAAAELLCTAGCHFGASSVTLTLTLTLTLPLPLPLTR